MEKQANGEAGGFQVVEALRNMNVIQIFHRLQFDQHIFFHQKIGYIITDNHAVIPNLNWMLLAKSDVALAKLLRQSVLINFFQKPAAQSIADGKCAANGLFG